MYIPFENSGITRFCGVILENDRFIFPRFSPVLIRLFPKKQWALRDFGDILQYFSQKSRFYLIFRIFLLFSLKNISFLSNLSIVKLPFFCYDIPVSTK